MIRKNKMVWSAKKHGLILNVFGIVDVTGEIPLSIIARSLLTKSFSIICEAWFHYNANLCFEVSEQIEVEEKLVVAFSLIFKSEEALEMFAENMGSILIDQ